MVRIEAYEITLLALIALSGCGDSRRASLSGSATLNGKPVDGGTISFIPGGRVERSAIWGDIRNGHYSLAGGSGLTSARIAWRFAGRRKRGEDPRCRRPLDRVL